MKMTLQTIMQKMASYVELVLSAFLLLVVVALSVRLIAQSVPQVWSQQIDVMYYLESAMTLAIGIEFVKMLCTHTSETVIEILLFAISRQMIVEHLSATETILGVGAIAGLFAVRKCLFCTIHKETRGTKLLQLYDRRRDNRGGYFLIHRKFLPMNQNSPRGCAARGDEVYAEHTARARKCATSAHFI